MSICWFCSKDDRLWNAIFALERFTSEKKKKNVIRYRSFFSSVFRFFSRVRFTSVSGIESRFHYITYKIRYSGILVFVIELILLKSISSFLWVLMKKEKWKRILNWEVSSHQSRLVYWKGRLNCVEFALLCRPYIPSQSIQHLVGSSHLLLFTLSS